MKKKSLKWLISIMVIVVVFILFLGGNERFGSQVYTAELKGGTLNFHPGSFGVAGVVFDFETTGRELTVEENETLFGNLGVTSYGIFNADDKTLINIEGNTGNTKVVLAAPGSPPGWVIGGVEETSEISGVQVTACYFVTGPSSKGIKDIIFSASFELNGVSILVQSGGNLDEVDAWLSEIASVIEIIIQNGAPDLSAITE